MWLMSSGVTFGKSTLARIETVLFRLKRENVTAAMLHVLIICPMAMSHSYYVKWLIWDDDVRWFLEWKTRRGLETYIKISAMQEGHKVSQQSRWHRFIRIKLYNKPVYKQNKCCFAIVVERNDTINRQEWIIWIYLHVRLIQGFLLFSPLHQSPLLPCASATGICFSAGINIKSFFTPRWPSVKAAPEHGCRPENWSLGHQEVTRCVLYCELECGVTLSVKSNIVWSEISCKSNTAMTKMKWKWTTEDIKYKNDVQNQVRLDYLSRV